MNLETIIPVILYLLIIAFLGYLGYRKTHGTSDYLVAGRQIHPFIMALSYGATFISTSAIVGFGGAAGVFGMGLLWLTFLNIMVGIFIAFVFFGKRTRRMGYHLHAHTFPEFISRRYQSPFMQKYAGIVIFIFMPLYAGSVMIGAARFLEHSFSINYFTALFFFSLIVAVYVIMGGLKAVMYTDAFQGSIMFVGMLILMIATYWILGGVTPAHSALTALPVPPPLAAKGHTGWTSMPSLGSVNWWVLVSTIIMGVGIGVLAQPQLVVRFMTVKSNRELNRAVMVGGLFILMMTGVAFTTGALTNVFFANNVPGMEFCKETGAIREVSPSSADVTVSPENLEKVRSQHPAANLGDKVTVPVGCTPVREGSISIRAAAGDVESIIPLYIKHSMPRWFGVLFMLTLLAAAMSTLSSQFHAMGTSIGRDTFEQIFAKDENSEEKSVWITKMGIGIGILVSAMLAYALPILFDKGVAIIARGTAIFFGLCACAFLPAYFGALYSRKITRAGAIAGMIGGSLSSVLWMMFFHEKESSIIGLCQMIFGRPAILGNPWDIVDPLFIGLPVSIVLTVAVSIFTKKLDDSHLDRCFKNIK